MLHFTTELGGDASRTDRLDGRGRHLRHRPRRGDERRRRRRADGQRHQAHRRRRRLERHASPWPATRSSTAGRWWSPAPSPTRSGRTASPTRPTATGTCARRSRRSRSRRAGAGPAAGAARGADLRGLSAGAARAQRPADDAGADRQPLLDRRRQPAGRQAGRRGRHDAALGRPRRGPPRLGAGRGLAGQPRSPTSSSATSPTTTWTSGSCRSAWTGRCTRPTTASSSPALTFSYGTVDTDVSSDDGDGSIATDGYGLGGTLTWLRDDDLYVDGQAQLMWYDSDLASDEVDEDLASGNDGFGYALGVEVGKRIPLKPSLDGHAAGAARLFLGRLRQLHRSRSARDVGGDEGASMPVRLGVSLDQESGWKARGRRRAADALLRHRQPLLRPDRRTPRSLSAAPGSTQRRRPVLGLARRRRDLQLGATARTRSMARGW